MIDPVHQQLLGHLLGALDDDEQEWLDARLEHDEKYGRELLEWRRRLSPLEAVRPDFEPPPGLADRTCRFVAARAPSSAAAPVQRRMSPECAPSSNAIRVGWPDVVAATSLLVVACILIFPAIQDSRFHARLAACQDGLRRFGLALTQYSNHHDAMSRIADRGRLTGVGVLAARVLKDDLDSGDHRPLYPDAWLAAQTETRVLANPLSPFHGPRRDAAMDGLSFDPQPAALPFLADAPLLDLSAGQALDGHDGRGRNVWFEDGHVDFLRHRPPRNATEVLLSRGTPPADSGISAPITFVNRR